MGDVGFTNKPSRCSLCVKLAKFLPVLLVWSLLGYSYYGYVYQFGIVTITSPVQQIVYILLYHITLFLLLWAYTKTVFTDISHVPKMFQLPDEVLEQFKVANTEDAKLQAIEGHGNTLPVNTRTFIGGRRTYRFCFICNHIKPDRAHHCRICGVCILKMDHHCPWVNNCISYANYKYFVLFLFYALVFCSHIAVTTFSYFLETWMGHFSGDGRIHILFIFVIAVMFCLCLFSIFSYHIYLTSYNRTTLEAFRAPVFQNGRADKHGFDMGLLNNFKQVLGDKIILWPIPIFTTSGDGISYDTHISPDKDSLLNPRVDLWSSDDENDNDSRKCPNDEFVV